MTTDSYKIINVSQKFMEPVESLDDIQEETLNLLNNLYFRYMNEQNKNNFDKCIKDLEFYRYVYDGYDLAPGISYIRYIYKTDIKDLCLKGGGIVLETSPYYFRIKLLKYKRAIYLNRRSVITFVKLTDDEIFKMNITK